MAKILNILSSKKHGGLEEAYVVYTRAMLAANHEVIMLVHPKAKMLDRLAEIKGAHLVTSWFCSRLSLFSYVMSMRLLHSIKPDLVILHNSRLLSVFKNALVINHGYNSKRIRQAKNIICVNSQIKEEVEIIGKSKAYILHNALTEILPLRPKPRSKNPVIGFMGRLSLQKGADIFLHAISMLSDGNYKAVIAGSGEEEASLRSLAKDLQIDHKVEFSGWIEGKEKFYDSIDIFCAPSRCEGFGLVILEAMSYGVPVITTLCDGPKDIIISNVSGIMVEPENAQAIATAIQYLIDNPDKCEDMRRNAHDALSKRFSFDRFTNDLNAIIQECI